jgi:two-component system chemotaxis sensor kinase CheA
MNDLLRIYFNETEELIDQILDNLDVLRSDPSQHSIDMINELMRKFHTIKGSSYSVGFMKIGEIAHKVEDILVGVRDGKIELNYDIILKMIDIAQNLKNFISALSYQESPSDENIQFDVESILKSDYSDSHVSHKVGTEFQNERKRAVAKEIEDDKKDVRSYVLEKIKDEQLLKELSDSELLQLKNSIERGKDIYLGFLKLSFEEDFDKKGRDTMEKIRELGFEIISTIMKIEGDFVVINFVLAPSRDTPDIKELEKIIKLQNLWRATQKTQQVDLSQQQKVSLKIEISEVEKIMNIIGDMVIVKNAIQSSMEKFMNLVGNQEIAQRIRDNISEMGRKIRELQDIVLDVRMGPIEDILKMIERTILTTARQLGKEVVVIREGENLTIDAEIGRRLRSALLHIARNAVSHGIESPEERIRAGKKPQGEIKIKAQRKGEFISIDITDDGRGIIPEKVLERYFAWRKEFPQLASHFNLGETELDFKRPDGSWIEEKIYQILFLPGFSTKNQADEGAGRGAGLYEVKKEIEESMKGKVLVKSAIGEGTTFTIIIPTTKIVVEVVIFKWKGEKFALPLSPILKTEVFPESKDISIRTIQGREIVQLGGREYPLITVDEIFGRERGNLPDKFFILIVEAGEGKYSEVGLVVEEIVDIKDSVMKNFDEDILMLRGISAVVEEIGEDGTKEIIPVVDIMRIPEFI